MNYESLDLQETSCTDMAFPFAIEAWEATNLPVIELRVWKDLKRNGWRVYGLTILSNGRKEVCYEGGVHSRRADAVWIAKAVSEMRVSRSSRSSETRLVLGRRGLVRHPKYVTH